MKPILVSVFAVYVLVKLDVPGVDDDAVGKAVIVNYLKRPIASFIRELISAFDGIILKLDVKSERRMILYKLHKLDKRRNLVSVACIKSLDLGQRHLANKTGTVCGSIDCVIMHQNDLSVLRHVKVGLDLVYVEL